MSDLIDIDTAAERMGVSKFLVYKLVARRELDHFKIGTCLRFSEEQLDRFLASRQVPAVAGPSAAAR